MIPVPSAVRVWLAVGHTDMRRGMNNLAVQVQQVLQRDPHAGDLYVFRGKRGHLIKILWHDGIGMSLYAKQLEHGRFIWPSPADRAVAMVAHLNPLCQVRAASAAQPAKRGLRSRRDRPRHLDPGRLGGACSATLAPLSELIRHVLAGERLHGDDTTVPVLAKNKTATGRLWTPLSRGQALCAGRPAVRRP